MKRQTIIGAALMIISLAHLNAQDSAKVNPSVSKGFSDHFPGAKNVAWKPLRKEISQAMFFHKENSWIAFFDRQGNLLTCGRRIKATNELPLKIQTSLEQYRKRVEKKFGPLAVALIYEMLKNDQTTYYITLENSMAAILMSAQSNGYASIVRKRMKDTQPSLAPGSSIAKKN